MSLLHKLRVLAGALVHKPFMPKPERVELDQAAEAPGQDRRPQERRGTGAQEPDLVDGERVADLIEKQQREQAG